MQKNSAYFYDKVFEYIDDAINFLYSETHWGGVQGGAEGA